jgi:hypothetical protein
MQRSIVLGRRLVSIPPFLHTRLVAHAIPRSHLQHPCNYTHRLHTNDGKPQRADASGSDRQDSKDSEGSQKPDNSFPTGLLLIGIWVYFAPLIIEYLQNPDLSKKRQIERMKEEQEVFKGTAFTTFVIESRQQLDPETVCLNLMPINIDPKQRTWMANPYEAFSKSGIGGVECRENEQGSTCVFLPTDDNSGCYIHTENGKMALRIVVGRLDTAGNYQHLFNAKSGTKIELRGPVLLLDLPKRIRNAILISDGAGKTYISKAAAILRPRDLSNTYKFILLDEIKDTFSSTQKSKSWNTNLSTIVGVELNAFEIVFRYVDKDGTPWIMEALKWKNRRKVSAVTKMDPDSFLSALELKFEELMAESTVRKQSIWDLAGSKVVIIAGCKDFLNQIEDERTLGNIENQTRLGHALARLESLGWIISTVEVDNTAKFRTPRENRIEKIDRTPENTTSKEMMFDPGIGKS